MNFFLFSLSILPSIKSFVFPFPLGPAQEGILRLHSIIMVYGFAVLIFVFCLLFMTYRSSVALEPGLRYDDNGNVIFGEKEIKFLRKREDAHEGKIFRHGSVLEIVWTMLPSIILASIAYPSLQLLYATDEVIEPSLTIKIGARQWFWNYSYNDELEIGGSLAKQLDQGLTRIYKVNFFEMYRLVVSTLKLVSTTEIMMYAPGLTEVSMNCPLPEEFSNPSKQELWDKYLIDCKPELMPSLQSRKFLDFLRPMPNLELVESDRVKFAVWKEEPNSALFDIIKFAPNFFVYEYVKPIEEHLYKILDSLTEYNLFYSKMLLCEDIDSVSAVNRTIRWKKATLLNRGLNRETALSYSFISQFLRYAKIACEQHSLFQSTLPCVDQHIDQRPSSYMLDVNTTREVDWDSFFQIKLEKREDDPFAYENFLLAKWAQSSWALFNEETIDDFIFNSNKNFIQFDIDLFVPIRSMVGGKLSSFNYDSYMVPEQQLKFGEPRLLKTDNPLVVPARTHLRFLVTSNDVLHSFAIPAAGIKIDAVPGRLNQVSAYFEHEGVFFGQCSELCGVNHGFMPIELVVLDPLDYLDWVCKKSGVDFQSFYFETPEWMFQVTDGGGYIIGSTRLQSMDCLLLSHLKNVEKGFEDYIFRELNTQFVTLMCDWGTLCILLENELNDHESSFLELLSIFWETHDLPWNTDLEAVRARRNLKLIKNKTS